jgi:UDP-N-acetylmuramoylalanine--D-glutamate ligase
LAHFILKTLGEKSFACGNIGIPPTTLDLAGASDDTRCVIELSSYQLEGCLPHSAAAAAITSFSSDHLARHKTLENYFAQKWRVTKWLRLDGVFIVSAEVARFASDFGAAWPPTRIIVIGAGSRPSYVPSHCEYFDVSRDTVNFNGLSIDWSALHCLGIHQRINALTAAIGVLRMSPALATGRVLETIAHYRPLPYRCEVVFKNESLQIINDSKSTNVESTLAALSISKRTAILLMGGQGKGESYAPVKDAHQKISRLITFGASGAVIMEEAHGIFPVEHFKTMAQACHHALELGIAGGQDVIFSPGCASFDEFRNFEHRGEEFSKIVKSRMSS